MSISTDLAKHHGFNDVELAIEAGVVPYPTAAEVENMYKPEYGQGRGGVNCFSPMKFSHGSSNSWNKKQLLPLLLYYLERYPQLVCNPLFMYTVTRKRTL